MGKKDEPQKKEEPNPKVTRSEDGKTETREYRQTDLQKRNEETAKAMTGNGHG